MTQGIILFAHGSRDPEWARPFEKIRSKLGRSLPGQEVRLAYLEHMTPSVGEALADLERLGIGAVRVVPLFFGLGGHLKQDLPRLVAEAGSKLQVTVEAPIGEQPQVIEAIAAAIASADRSSP